MNYAPIALFVYNRPQHTMETVQALLKNPECALSNLYIFSDAAKNVDAQDAVNKVREYVRQISGFRVITVIEREENWGLANSIIDGVTQLCYQYGKVIVLEDDLETSPYFLKYMNDGLSVYEFETQVSSVSGYMYPIDLAEKNKTFLSKMPQSWGWATWSRAWGDFNVDGSALLTKLSQSKSLGSFNKNGPHNYVKMLQNQIKGKNNSWYIRWYASLFLKQKLTLMPCTSLIRNIGIDGSGTHCAEWRYNPFSGAVSNEPITVSLEQVVFDKEIEKKLATYYKRVKLLRYINFVNRLIKGWRKYV